MEGKLNICLISREFAPDTAFGGMATFSFDTAKMLQSYGHKVTVFSQSLGPSSIIDFEGITVYKIKVPKIFASYNFLPIFILAFNAVIYYQIMKCHSKQPFDIIDVPDHLAEGLFVSKFSNIPVVTRLHTPYSLIVALGLNNIKINLSSYIIKYFEKVALQASRALYAPCEDMFNRCDQLFNLKSSLHKKFNYPLDLSMFSVNNDDSYYGPLRILFVGRLEQRKGIEIIAQAFPKLIAESPDVLLTIVGGDTHNIEGNVSCKTYLVNYFLANKCNTSVTFLDAVPLQALPGIFHAHDVVWIPSLFDNYPLVCLEAMACGKAIIASDIGGLPEMVTHGKTGFICKVGNAQSLVHETLKLCYSRELIKKIGKNARAFIETNCSLDVVYNNTLDFYKLALNKVN